MLRSAQYDDAVDEEDGEREGSDKEGSKRVKSRSGYAAIGKRRNFYISFTSINLLRHGLIRVTKLYQSRLLQFTHASTRSRARYFADTGEHANHCPKPGLNF